MTNYSIGGVTAVRGADRWVLPSLLLRGSGYIVMAPVHDQIYYAGITFSRQTKHVYFTKLRSQLM